MPDNLWISNSNLKTGNTPTHYSNMKNYIPLIIFLFSISAFLLIAFALAGCKSEPENIMPVIQLTEPLNHKFTYTNKISGFYLANTHDVNGSIFDGWTVNEHHYLQDFYLMRDARPIARDSLRIFNYYPDRYQREYSCGLSETFTMLDSLDALVWEFELESQIEHLSFLPVLPSPGKNYRTPLSQSNPRLVLSPTDLFTETTDPDLLYLEFDWILLNRHQVLITAVLGKDPPSIQKQATYLAENYKRLQQQRYQRMRNIVQANTLITNMEEINEAVAWSQISADALVTQQRGVGIWAGLPWFNNYWGRDTFISFSGTLLLSGQFQLAKKILQTFAGFQETDESNPLLGRIPNRITNKEIIYNTADGTWWFIRAVYEYLLCTADPDFALSIFPVLKRAINGALRYRVDKYFFITHGDAETWMDAQYDHHAWSPRGNRAVEIQALWYTAVQCAAQVAIMNGQSTLAEHWLTIASTLKDNFIEWYYSPVKGHLYDHLNADGSKDNKIRPNQIFAISVPELPGIEPLLPPDYQMRIGNEVLQKLTYRYGVASLWQEDEDFHPWHHYESVYPQDAAYHNGVVWTWLAGPVISSLTKFHQQDLAYQLFFNETNQILHWDAIGNFSELLDALPRPGEKNPRVSGTVSQAWSLAGYISNFYQNFIGYRPDALHSLIYFKLHIPYELNTIQVNLAYKNYYIHFIYQEVADRYTVRIVCPGLQEKINIVLNFPGFNPLQFSLAQDNPELVQDFFKDERTVYQPENDLEWYFAQPESPEGLKVLKGIKLTTVE
jgi:glycogen debranching enzyme